MPMVEHVYRRCLLANLRLVRLRSLLAALTLSLWSWAMALAAPESTRVSAS